MILKNADEKQSPTKIEEYGYKAEQQMAYYLKCKYQDDNKIRVINDLRLDLNGDVAQIDHLIIHTYGFIIIESKSVTAKISINKHGEWQRHYQKFSKGMPSPINQAKRQIDILQKSLILNSDSLFKKILFFKADVTKLKFEVLVAISDDGIIERSADIKLEEVLKADQITDAIDGKIASYDKTNKSFLNIDVLPFFAGDAMNKVSTFLHQSHKSKKTFPQITNKVDIKPTIRIKKEQKATIVAEKKTATYEVNHCKVCKSNNVQIVYGKYGYYFKCSDCAGNTGLSLKCKTAKCKPKLKKSKLNFFQICEHCDSSKLYFSNKS